DALPTGPALAARQPELRRRFALAGGDDYELCFTAPADRRDAVLAAARASETVVTRIGRIESGPGLRLTDGNGAPLVLDTTSFDHFASS
ncbi:MAG TPA: thiamine-phosphate kinase, partial [Noviherbaspirillum sp.]|nr:thiamine-phosphate kinase [Noviherbaspirillum sp.]